MDKYYSSTVSWLLDTGFVSLSSEMIIISFFIIIFTFQILTTNTENGARGALSIKLFSVIYIRFWVRFSFTLKTTSYSRYVPTRTALCVPGGIIIFRCTRTLEVFLYVLWSTTARGSFFDSLFMDTITEWFGTTFLSLFNITLKCWYMKAAKRNICTARVSTPDAISDPQVS